MTTQRFDLYLGNQKVNPCPSSGSISLHFKTFVKAATSRAARQLCRTAVLIGHATNDALQPIPPGPIFPGFPHQLASEPNKTDHGEKDHHVKKDQPRQRQRNHSKKKFECKWFEGSLFSDTPVHRVFSRWTSTPQRKVAVPQTGSVSPGEMENRARARTCNASRSMVSLPEVFIGNK